jgi:hypothetical protein
VLVRWPVGGMVAPSKACLLGSWATAAPNQALHQPLMASRGHVDAAYYLSRLACIWLSALPCAHAWQLSVFWQVTKLPYGAHVDIRDTVNYKNVMKQYSLGPNGAILTSLNLFATRFDQVPPSAASTCPSSTFACMHACNVICCTVRCWDVQAASLHAFRLKPDRYSCTYLALAPSAQHTPLELQPSTKPPLLARPPPAGCGPL